MDNSKINATSITAAEEIMTILRVRFESDFVSEGGGAAGENTGADTSGAGFSSVFTWYSGAETD